MSLGEPYRGRRSPREMGVSSRGALVDPASPGRKKKKKKKMLLMVIMVVIDGDNGCY